MVVPSWEVEHEDQKFKVILSHISSRPAQATRDPVSKIKSAHKTGRNCTWDSTSRPHRQRQADRHLATGQMCSKQRGQLREASATRKGLRQVLELRMAAAALILTFIHLSILQMSECPQCASGMPEYHDK